MRKTKFAKNHYYHIFNRGVDKRKIFNDDRDRGYFIKLVHEFQLGCSGAADVKVHVYCLMGNHFHLLVEQLSDGGITRFMGRLAGVYVRYFNKRVKRKGRLFESEYKSVTVESDGHLGRLIAYIHLNPVRDLIEKKKSPIELVMKGARNWEWSDCDVYLQGRGSLNYFFDDINYRSFLKTVILIYRDLGSEQVV